MDKALDFKIRGRELFSVFGFRFLQPLLAHANEINRDIHLANTLI